MHPTVIVKKVYCLVVCAENVCQSQLYIELKLHQKQVLRTQKRVPLTSNTFKERYTLHNHISSLRVKKTETEHQPFKTLLGNKNKNASFEINWSILAKGISYHPDIKFCNLYSVQPGKNMHPKI